MIETQITRLLGIRYPVLQGGMAWVSSASLVAAVSNAGGLGVLGAGPMDPDTLTREIHQIKSLTNKPFGVNIMLMMPPAPELVKICVNEKVPVVTTGAGNPGPYVKALKDAGSRVIPVISSVALAKRLERSGVDAIIAEGNESGGHIGEISTMVLIPQVADAVKIPVIAAGGIADGRGILAALSLGAQGVQMGTRFILAEECHVHENYKKVVANAKDRDTCITGLSTGHPVRVIRNKIAKYYLEREHAGATPQELDDIARGTLRKAVHEGDVDNGSVMAGQICGLIDRVETAAEIFARMDREFHQAYEQVSGLFNANARFHSSSTKD